MPSEQIVGMIAIKLINLMAVNMIMLIRDQNMFAIKSSVVCSLLLVLIVLLPLFVFFQVPPKRLPSCTLKRWYGCQQINQRCKGPPLGRHLVHCSGNVQILPTHA